MKSLSFSKWIIILGICIIPLACSDKKDDPEPEIEDISEKITDPAFRTYCLTKFDADNDGKLTVVEASAVKKISLTYPSSTNGSLAGIEYFTALEELICSYCSLKDIDISKNINLMHLELGGNLFSSIDLSKNAGLTYLRIGNTPLTSIDLSKNTKLTYLDISSTSLTSIDLSKNTELKELYCEGEPDVGKQLTSLDVSTNIKLEKLYCSRNRITDLDVSKHTALQELFCDENQMTNLKLGNNTELIYLMCNVNQITSLDLSGFKANGTTKIQLLGCVINPITTIWVWQGFNTQYPDFLYVNGMQIELSNPKDIKFIVKP